MAGRGPTTARADASTAVERALAQAWTEAEPAIQERIDAVEEHVATALLGEANDETRSTAAAAAHKLAGTLGMFGMPAGSTHARELEDLLGTDTEPDARQLERMAALANGIRASFEERAAARNVSGPEPLPDAPARLTVRVVGRDSSFLEAVGYAGAEQGLAFDHFPQLPANARPADVTIVDAASVSGGEDAITGARRLGGPVMVIAENNTMEDRLRYLRAGAGVVVSPTTPPDRIVELIDDLVANPTGVVSVVAVGIDPGEVERMRTGLGSEGCAVEVVANPNDVGDAIETASPDALLVGPDLDDLDQFSVLEVIASDPSWSDRWVVALTSSSADTAGFAPTAMASGADDVVAAEKGWPAVARRLRHRSRRGARRTKGRFGASSDRARLEMQLTAFCDASLASGTPMSLLLFRSIDLRQVNMTEGYRAGDRLLGRIEELLRTFFRSGDVLGAWVGGSFVVAMDVPPAVGNSRLSAALAELEQAGLPCRGAVASAPTDATVVDELVRTASRRCGGATAAAPTSFGPRRRIVVVEDDEIMAGLVCELLETDGHDVQLIPDGPGAIDVLCDPDGFETIAMALLDVTLPGTDGFGVLRAMDRANTLHRIPVVMLSARTLEGEINAALELGAVDFVGKPFSPQVLLRRVERAMALVSS